jgi:hypothetical protein
MPSAAVATAPVAISAVARGFAFIAFLTVPNAGCSSFPIIGLVGFFGDAALKTADQKNPVKKIVDLVSKFKFLFTEAPVL